ncbi:MAG: amidohydrolase [Bacteroidia bacterium]|nr:MAG: amidohydrolase [Bacteroidia bacterium]
MITKDILRTVTGLRKELHRFPELSGNEINTAEKIRQFLADQKPDTLVVQLGSHGLAAVFDSGKDGPSVLFRCDMDALPIEEVNTFSHRSHYQGISHKCGHDGHMAIMAGFSMLLKNTRPEKGRVVLLFQPEEETGQGAAKVICDSKFSGIKPDYVFALHNLPGFEKKAVIVREGPFAAASKGMIISLQGKSSHAAHPEQGQSPVLMMTELMEGLMKIPERSGLFHDFVLVTIIHARLGEVAFGTNPGKATVMATLRTFLDEDMEILHEEAGKLVDKLSAKHGIESKISFTEEFPATVNHAKATGWIREAAGRSGTTLLESEDTFRWSEDFGHFTSKSKGALFGLGAGKNHTSLHNHDYDFPDEIIETGIAMFYHIADQIVKINRNV